MGTSKKREFSSWGCRKQSVLMGTMYEKTTQIAELPEEGDSVIVHECRIYKDSIHSGKVVTFYRPSSPYLDAFGFPAIYTVSGFTRGKGAALDKKNMILLERRCKNGYVQRTSVSALQVATGAMKLQVVAEDEDIELYKSKYYSYKNAIVRETSTELVEKAMVRKRVNEEAV